MKRTDTRTINVGKKRQSVVKVEKASDDMMFIERRIISGLIVSTDYVRQIRSIWRPDLLNSPSSRMIASWCIDYYDQYKKAPVSDIEGIFEKKKKKLSEKIASSIEDFLVGLSDEYKRKSKFNVQYLVDQTKEYLQGQNIESFVEDLKEKLDAGDLDVATNLIYNFKEIVGDKGNVIDFGKPEVYDVIKTAFNKKNQRVFKYPRKLGEFLNDLLNRSCFVAFMGPEKRGKTYFLLDMAIRAVRQNCNVAFFEAGDMTEDQLVGRAAVYLTGKPDKEKYLGEHYRPVRDCVFNQMDDCDKKERECNVGPFPEADNKQYILNKSFEELIKAKKNIRGYRACHNCQEYNYNRWGTIWYQRTNLKDTVNERDAKKAFEKYFIKHNRNLKLATYPSDTLTVTEIKNVLNQWEKEDGFVADLIIVDYVDIMASEVKADFRHKENQKWMGLRGLSQEKRALVATVTQTDADSYERDLLSARNYSEDKRKYAHVTATIGMNQDKHGLDKKKGILRLNKIVVREDAFIINDEVHVMQDLTIGRPVVGSYYAPKKVKKDTSQIKSKTKK